MKIRLTISYCLVLATLFTQCSNNKNASSAGSGSDTSTAKAVLWLTTPDERQLLQRQPASSWNSPDNNYRFIDVDANETFQAMEGFGYTLTGGSAYVINRMQPSEKKALLQELFSTQGIGISYLRVSIGASDRNETVFTYNDMPSGQTDPTLAHFSLDPDRADVIPLLKEILAINPRIPILGSPWTPPVWMKDNNSSIGGSLKPEYYGPYAQYFVRYVQEMKKEGITIDAITPQNEPLHPGNNPSLLMLAVQQADFIKNHLGPAFRNAGINTKIIIYDHNCDKPEYPISILNDPEAKKFIHGSAFHLYAGDISAMGKVHETHPDKSLYFTEQYTSVDGKFDGDLQWHIKNLIIGAPRNWSRTVLEWNLANDAKFGPHTPGGCTTCKGALTIDGSQVKRNVAYYVIGHASKFVPPESVRIGSNMLPALPNVAYQRPDGTFVMIVLNEASTETSFNLRMQDKWTITLPAGSAATVEFD